MLTDDTVWERFQTTALIVGSSVLLQLVVGFLLALLFERQFPLRRILLTLVLTPMMLSPVAVGVFFKLYYEPTFGLVSQFINTFFTGEPFALLATPTGAVIGIVVADAWMWSPFVMLLVLAGLVSVPKYLYEAAEVDRASWWRRFCTITFPYIRSLLLLAILFRTIETFKLFDIVYIITAGRPGLGDRDDRRLHLPGGVPELPHQPVHRARLHRAVRRDRADEPLPLRGQRRNQRGDLMARLTGRRIRIGKAGWGWTAFAGVISLIYFFPVLWIILTAFKSRGDALAVPASSSSSRPRTTSSTSSSAPSSRRARRMRPASCATSSTRSSSPGPACSSP